jgi:hypothetical protein
VNTCLLWGASCHGTVEGRTELSGGNLVPSGTILIGTCTPDARYDSRSHGSVVHT